MMAMPNTACYQCIVAHDNHIATCAGVPPCLADYVTPDVVAGGMDSVVNTLCRGSCTTSCDAGQLLVIEDKRAFLGGGCDARGTPHVSTCPPAPAPPEDPVPAPEDPVPDPSAPPPASSATRSLTFASKRINTGSSVACLSAL